MELIYEILNRLTRREVRIIRNRIKASAFEYERVGKLFELVTRYKNKSESFFSQKLYGEEPNNTFRVTKSRLKKMLEDVLVEDKSLNSYDADYINAYLSSKKRLLQGEILLGRGAYKASKNLLLQVLSTAKKFHFHDLHFEAMMLLHRNQSINASVREYKKRTSELLALNQIQREVHEAAILQYSITNLLTNKTINQPQKQEELKANIERIYQILKQTNSPVAAYHYYNTAILFAQSEFRYEDAKQLCEQYINLLHEEPALRSQTRIANANFQMTDISLKKNDLDKASKYVTQTLSFFTKTETNYLIVLGTAFRIAFFSGEYQKAESILEEAFAHPRLEASKMRFSIWHYFKACLLFKKGEKGAALRQLDSATGLLSDKMGWNISFRLLEIILLHEMELYDLLDAKILNMRQYIKRTHKNEEYFRPSVLISILMEWHRNAYNFKKTMPLIKEQLEKLEKHHKSTPFDLSSGELIKIEDWIQAKVKA